MTDYPQMLSLVKARQIVTRVGRGSRANTNLGVTQTRRDSIRPTSRRNGWGPGPTPTRPDPAEFTDIILPGPGISYSQMSRQTALSPRYCKLIAGENVPHPMHWDVLRLPADGSISCSPTPRQQLG